MKRLVNLGRTALTIVLYLAVLVCAIWPQGMARRALMRLRGVDAPTRRRVNAAHNTRWGNRLMALVRAVMGLDVRVARAPVRADLLRLPRIYVINHKSTLDIAVLLHVASLMDDLDVRWVIKRGILSIPFVGGLMRDTGYAVVWRRKDAPRLSDDLRRDRNVATMEWFADRAREDAVSVGVFPEGERFLGAAPGAARQRVGALKGKAGFRTLCQHLPLHVVADITVLWPTVRGRTTLFDADVFCDRTVEVRVDVYPHVPPELADAFLEGAWDRKESLLAAVRS